MKPGNVIYGSWKDDSDIFKDSKGYWIIQYDPKTQKEFKKYLKGWTPSPNTKPICRTFKVMKFCNTRSGLKNKKKKSSTQKKK